MPNRPAPSTSQRKRPHPAVPAREDLDQAKEDALLQLRIGRSAHLYTVGISVALALDGMFLLLVYPHLPSVARGGATGLAALGGLFYFLIPVLAGLAIASIALIIKWEAFQLWPWEPHFSTTVAAMAVNVLVFLAYASRIAGIGPLAHLGLYPWFFPVSLFGISLALVGLVLTWSPWDRRHWVSAVSAGLPLATALLVYFPPSSSTTGSESLAVALFLSAILYQTSGSFLHLISSGTAPHEQALISAGQGRIFQLADQLRKKEAALRFRETAVVKREADAEASDKALQREQVAFADTRSQIEQLDTQTRERSEGVAQRERALAGRVAEVEALARQLEGRVQTVELREQEITRQVPQMAAREQRLAQREGDQTKRDAELEQRRLDVERRGNAANEAEARLAQRRKELESKTTELLRREGELSARGPTKGGSTATGPGSAADLAGREAKLKQLQAALDEQNATLGRKAKEATERSKAFDEQARKATEREAALAAREAALGQQEGDLTGRLKSADARRTDYEAAVKEVQQKLQELSRQQVDAAQRGADLDRSMSTVGQRETSIKERERKIKEDSADLDRREREVTARERAAEAAEAEIGLRLQEAPWGGDVPPVGAGGLKVTDVAGTEKGRGGPPPAKPGPSTPTDEILAPTSGRRYADRIGTGTTRLDDLLLGGIPPKGHVVLLGDAFVGKEIVLYAYVAEGLKRGEPVILVTAARSPTEVSQSLGVVLPQFLEYEQKGMVVWIDASGSGAGAGPHRLVTKGSDDRAGILSALVDAAKIVEGGHPKRFRVGFLGVSAVFAHSDERASFSFLNNVVAILKPREAVALYALEGGALTEAQVESMLGRMDGAIVFRQDRDRTFLSVKGFGDVQTREWVECRATNRNLIVGSFALERIR